MAPISQQTVLSLTADTYVCEHASSAIFLNLRRNRYLAVDAETLIQVRPWVRGWADLAEIRPPSPPSIVQELVSGGLLTPYEMAGKCFEAPDVRVGDSIFEHASLGLRRPKSLAVLNFMRAYTMAAGCFRARRIAFFINRLLRKDLSGPTEDSKMLEHIAGAVRCFNAIRLWAYTAKRACLLDSLVLTAYLAFERLPSTLIFGVKTKPFGAHAWVQYGPHVLNDDVESVLEYTPILVRHTGEP